MRMDNISFSAALHKLAERVGYRGSYSIHDLNIQSTDDSFIIVREKVEIAVYRKAKQVYNYLRGIGISLPELYHEFELLWGWYDKIQYLFDKKLFKGTSSEILVGKMYTFYEEFLKRLTELESICLKM